VGLLDFLKPKPAVDDGALSVIPDAAGPIQRREKGVSGTSNWNGDILAESNTKLIHGQAYGQSGSRTWGEWEKVLRTDSDVASAISFNAAQVRDANVSITAAKTHPDPALAKAQADFVRWNLLEALEPGWAELSQQMVRGMLGFGFSLHERVYAPCENALLPGGKGWKVAKLAERLPVSLTQNPWIRENGELKAIRQRGEKDGKWAEVELAASDVILCTWDRNGDNYAGFPQTRSVWYLCKIREQLLKLVGISAVREGAGIPVAKVDKDTKLSKVQRKKLSKLLSNLVAHENASVVLPSGVDLNWVYSPGANKGHVLDLWNRLGLAILMLFQAQELALGAGETGSRSVGEVHAARSGSFVRGITAVLEAGLNGVGSRPYQGLIKALVDLNWGPQPAYPVLKFDIKPPMLEPAKLVTAVKDAVAAGALTPTLDMENSIREQLGFKPIEAATRQALAPKVPPVLQPDIFGKVPGQPAHPPPGAAVAPPKPKAVQPVAARRLAMGQPFTPSRALRPSEQTLDLARMDSFLNNARDEFERMVKPEVVAALVRAEPAIKKAMADGDPSDVSEVPLDFSRVAAAVGAFVEKCRAEGYAQVQAEKRRGNGKAIADARANGGQAQAPVARLAEEDDKRDDSPPDASPEAAPTPPSRTSQVLEAQKKALAKRMEQRLRAELEREAIDVIRRNGDEADVVAETVQGQLDTGAFKADASSVLTKAWNMGRDEFIQERGDEVESAEYSAILDSANCEPCQSMDGTTFDDITSDDYLEALPPYRECEGGDRCRCTMVFTFKKDGGDE